MKYQGKSFSVAMGSASSEFADRWEQTFGGKEAAPTITVTDGLGCDHCGGTAIYSRENLYFDGDGEKCAECGFPGYVSVDDSEPDDYTARWVPSEEDDEARCNNADCDECHPKMNQPLAAIATVFAHQAIQHIDGAEHGTVSMKRDGRQGLDSLIFELRTAGEWMDQLTAGHDHEADAPGTPSCTLCEVCDRIYFVLVSLEALKKT